MEHPRLVPKHHALERAFVHSRAYLDGLDVTSVAATATRYELRARLLRPLADDGVEPARVIDEMVADSAGGLLGSAGGRFFGWVIGGALPAALAADWLTSAWDQNSGLYACGPASSVIEETCGIWLKDLLGLPPAASFALVTGCQMSHVTCLAAARHRLLASLGGMWSGGDFPARRKFAFSRPTRDTARSIARCACWDLAPTRSSIFPRMSSAA